MKYNQLWQMLQKANGLHDLMWDTGQQKQAYRYTKIGIRILEAMTRISNKTIKL